VAVDARAVRRARVLRLQEDPNEPSHMSARTVRRLARAQVQVLVLGAADVGKSSLLLGALQGKHRRTRVIETRYRTIVSLDGHSSVLLHLHDLEGATLRLAAAAHRSGSVVRAAILTARCGAPRFGSPARPRAPARAMTAGNAPVNDTRVGDMVSTQLVPIVTSALVVCVTFFFPSRDSRSSRCRVQWLAATGSD